LPSRVDAVRATPFLRAALARCVLGASAALCVATPLQAANGPNATNAATPVRPLDAARVEAAASAVRADPDLGGVRKESTWRLRDLKRLLELPGNVVQLDFLETHPLIRSLDAYRIELAENLNPNQNS